MVTATIRDVLKKKGSRILSIDPERTVLEALQMMAQHDIGAVLVMQGGVAVGMLSERDYARKVILMGRTSKDTKVRDIMSTSLRTVSPRDSVMEAMAIMTQYRIRHLPVVEEGGVVGMVSIGDLVKRVIEEQQEHIRHLENYITGQYMA